MADPLVLTNATVWLGGYDLSGQTNEINWTTSRAENPDSRFSDTVEATYPGPFQVSAEVSGHWQSAVDGPLFTQLKSPTTDWPLTICPDGADDGEAAWGIRGYTFNYSALETSFGELLPYRLSVMSKSGGELGRGKVMLPKATYTATADGTKHQLGAVTSSQKLVASLHVFSVSGTWDFDVESDADASAGGETTRASFTQVTSAPTREVIEVAGPVTDTYWSVEMTETSAGSIVAAITYAIVNV